MMTSASRLCTLFPLLLAALLLPGCAAVVATGVTTAGVAAVEERSIGDFLDDNTIHAEIQHKFLQSEINELLLRVKVRINEGRVLLMGDVARPETAVEAVRLAWLARGVREVINEIKVTNTPTNAGSFARDEWIEAQIEARLIATKNVMSINYSVEVVDGVAYLLGIARDEKELRDVTTIASRIRGIRKVVSYVRLREDPRRKQLRPTGSAL